MNKKRLFMLAGGIILVLIIGTILLVSCGKNDAADGANAEAIIYDPWEYTSLVAKCEYDRSSKDVICSTNDGLTSVTNLLSSMGVQGWELGATFTATGGGNTMTVFSFKRPVNP